MANLWETGKRLVRVKRTAIDAAPGETRCAACIHFRNDRAFIEAAFAGLTSLGSASGSTRADDGICLRHDRYLGARGSCPDFSRSGALA